MWQTPSQSRLDAIPRLYETEKIPLKDRPKTPAIPNIAVIEIPSFKVFFVKKQEKQTLQQGARHNKRCPQKSLDYLLYHRHLTHQ